MSAVSLTGSAVSLTSSAVSLTGSSAAAGSARKPSARERLLAAADQLFYAEGVHTVGIDRIIEHAGVAKASLYSTFGSKDELVRAYLQGRHQARRDRITAKLAPLATPREKLLGVFDALAEATAAPGFRGCAFYNASAESTDDGPARQVCAVNRTWTRSLFTDLARQAGARDPDGLADQLVILYDGTSVGARMDRSVTAARTARAMAAALLDAVTG
jgi:AcrR family transcriptional regulator